MRPGATLLQSFDNMLNRLIIAVAVHYVCIAYAYIEEEEEE